MASPSPNSVSIVPAKISPGIWFAVLAVALVACAPTIPAPPDDDLRIGGGKIHIIMESNLPVSQAAAVAWVHRAAVAVTGYLGHFPSPSLTVTIKNGGDEPIGGGVTYGDSRIEVQLGPSAGESDLRQDWIMTHEMFHLAFPTLESRHLWMMEGLSDYLEPVARARAGQVTAKDAWREFVAGLPQGLPQEGDRGLDNTHTRERIYWGGNLYWLLADVRIRVKTNNRRGVEDAIRAILAAGGNGASEWSLDRVLSVGDQATGTTVLKDLHDELGPGPGDVDLSKLWRKLGVKYRFGFVHFDNEAPWAKIREAIMAPNHLPTSGSSPVNNPINGK